MRVVKVSKKTLEWWRAVDCQAASALYRIESQADLIRRQHEMLKRCQHILSESEWTEVGVDVRAGEARSCPYCFQAEPSGHGDVRTDDGFRGPCPMGEIQGPLAALLKEVEGA